ncbi:flagellar motor protein MotB [Caballeronia sp. LZ035]|uniref:flagellar motor protein MotB n=1 Tax=Caballeronia sp. LZ035 TaxID=3038568 RepID=UPI0028670C35|nr:flagellar motor protein MotB [Caballeronia sp. LZ035]MDR5761470.1 flagellar motor protein MotB [Caballeronia sp. LZ035]
MLGIQTPARRRSRDDGEKPFWISFSDLMTALMVLFLVALSVALLAVTKHVSEAEREEKQRAEQINALMQEVRRVAEQFDGVRVIGTTIDFGPRGRFEREGQNTLSEPQRALLRAFTPRLLEQLRTTDAGKHWFKRATVEGYASRSGKYLFNLNLSLERSERVLCELLRDPGHDEPTLSFADRALVATRFFVGGASFNSLRATADDSRRIEIKLEFKSRQERKDEAAQHSPGADDGALEQALDPKERCPLSDR